jgi:DNA-binding LacI/PurR family transcriptional regulator
LSFRQGYEIRPTIRVRRRNSATDASRQLSARPRHSKKQTFVFEFSAVLRWSILIHAPNDAPQDAASMTKRIGLKTLAAQLGLDVSTVSRALRDDPRVKDDTRRAVQDLARSLDYRPNAAARALRGGKTGRVVLMLSPPQGRLPDPILHDLLPVLERALRETGHGLSVVAARDPGDEDGLIRRIVDEGPADAVVLGATRRDDARVRMLLDARVPFVTFGRTDWPDRHPWVAVDYFRAGRLAIGALAESAGRDIHVLSASEDVSFAEAYVDGALAEAAARDLPDPTVWRVAMSEEAGHEVAARVLATHAAPAFACITNALAFGIFGAAAEAGRTVGRDVAVFGGQDAPGTQYLSSPLSTVSTNDPMIAELLSQVVVRHLARDGNAPECGFEHHEIAPQLVLRRSHRLETDGAATRGI